MKNFKITCSCGRFVSKNKDLFRFSCYKVKNPTIKRSSNNERIIEEIFFYYICPQCDKDIVFIKRKAINARGAIKILIPEKLEGLKAVDYLNKTKNIRINKTNELNFSENKSFARGIPLSYFKTIDLTHQRSRYINEAGYSGYIVENILKIYGKNK